MNVANSSGEVCSLETAGSLSGNIRITVSANQGGRKYMEDRVHIEHVRSDDGLKDYTYVAVYDGHGGADASEFVRKNLLKNIQKQEGFNAGDEEMLEAIRKGFIETHYAMWKVVDGWPLTASGYTSTAGTTASVVFIRRGKLFTGHVGDSAIIVGKKQGNEITGTCLTVDHKPDNLTEEERINKAGGMVMRKSGVMRVVWTRPLKGHTGPIRRSTPTESIAFLAVARSLGDLWSYNRDTKQFVVSPEPDVSVYSLNNTHLCLVLGSDGLTNVLKPQQIAELVNKCESDNALTDGEMANHSRFLLRHALQGWGSLRADNITVVTVLFDGVEDDEVNSELYERWAQSSGSNMDLNELFTENPTALVRITSAYCQEFVTSPISIIYTGALDQQFTSEIDYFGPGFCKQIVRDNPIMPSKNPGVLLPIRRSTSCAAMSSEERDGRNSYYCFIDFCDDSGFTQNSSNVNGCTNPNCNDEFTENALSSGQTEEAAEEEGFFSNAPPLTRRPSIRLSRKVTDAASRNVVFSLRESQQTSPCTKDDVASHEPGNQNKEPVAEVVSVAEVHTCSSSFFGMKSPGEKESVELLSERTYSASRPVAIVSPFETTPTSSGRKRLIPFRRSRNSSHRKRGTARRNLLNDELTSQSDEEENNASATDVTDSDSKENGDLWDEKRIAETVTKESTSVKRPNRHSLGGASALSPMLMLAALRVPDQLMLRRGANDPLRRELATFRSARYCSSILSPTTSKLGQLKIEDESSTLQKEASEVFAAAQKRKAAIDGNSNVSAEPAPKRSRLWGFFSSLIGDRKSK